MDTGTILHASDMTVPTPNSLVRRLGLNKRAEELGASLEAKTYARSGASLPKKFYDEIYPLALFVKHELAGTPDATVTPNLNNDNFDATIFFGISSRTLYVEVTCAKDGYDESRRIEVLTRAGSVNLTGPIVKTQGAARYARPSRRGPK